MFFILPCNLIEMGNKIIIIIDVANDKSETSRFYKVIELKPIKSYSFHFSMHRKICYKNNIFKGESASTDFL